MQRVPGIALQISCAVSSPRVRGMTRAVGIFSVESGWDRSVCPRHLDQMTVGDVLRSLDSGRKFRDFVIIRDKCKFERFLYFQPRQQNKGLLDGNIVLRCLCEDSDKAKFCHRARCDFRDALSYRDRRRFAKHIFSVPP
jgi:hypothetical protein